MILCGNHPRNAKVYHADVSAAQLCFAGQTMPVFNRDGSLVLPADFMCGCPKGELLGPCEHSAENPYSNEALGREAARSLGSRPTGGARIAAALLKLPFELRAAAATEARIFGNTSPGWRQSDAAIRVVERFLKGDTRTPLTDWNADMLAKEKRGEVVAGKW